MKKLCIDKTVFCVFILTISLAIFGCIMVYSASCYVAETNLGNKFYYLTKQIIGVILGTVAMVAFSFFDYKKLKKIKWWVVIISVLLLLLVFVPGIGIAKYGAKRWIGFGGFSIQPSEIAKFALVLFASAHFTDNYKNVKEFKALLPVIAIGLIFCLLVILEPNMSITICIGVVMMLMLFVGGASAKHFSMLCLPAGAVLPILIAIEPYRIKRLVAFLNPWASPQGEGFQLIQSLYSLGSGGWFGVGLFNSRQKYMFLPFAESDFIFSIIGEEFGFVGCVGVLACFFALIFMLVKISKNCPNRFGCLLSVGVAGVIAIQTLINVAVVSGAIPPTGLSLPFISAGSTSILVFMSVIGVCLNIQKQSIKSRIIEDNK
ncbi:MAG: putative lipid II flippase FtsW [Clostridia bacterium]